MATEADLYKLLKNGIPDAHWQRLESWKIAGGIPDVNGCLNGIDVWVELKVSPNETTELQDRWIEKRIKAGGRVFILTIEDAPGRGVVKNRRCLMLQTPQPQGSPLSPIIVAFREPFEWSLIRDSIFPPSLAVMK